MNPIKRTVRQVRPHGSVMFDEQLWPILLALIVLGSFVAGLSLSYLRFDDPRWYANAWTSLLADAVVVFGGAFLSAQVNQRMMRRAMQLSLILCSIIHLALLVFLHEMYLWGATTNSPKDRLVERELPPVTIPDYAAHHFLDPNDRPVQDVERPVETQAPDPEDDLVVRQQTDQREDIADRAVATETDRQQNDAPTLVRRETQALSIVRHSEEMSKLSKQAADSRVNSPQEIEVPLAPAAVPTKLTLQSQSESAAKRESESVLQRSANQAPETASSSVASPQSAQRQSAQRSEVQPSASAMASLSRPIEKSRSGSRTTLPSPEAPSIPRRTPQEALEPSRISPSSKLTTNSNLRERPTEESPVTALNSSSQLAERQSPAETTENVAQTPQPIRAPRTRLTDRPDAQIGAAVSSIQRASSPDTMPQPQLAQLNRPGLDSLAIARPTIEPQLETAGNVSNSARAIRHNGGLDREMPPDTSSVPRSRPTQQSNSVAKVATPDNSQSSERESASLQSASLRASNVNPEHRQSSSDVARADPRESELASINPLTKSMSMSRSQSDTQSSVHPDRSANRSPMRSVRPSLTAASPTNADRPSITSADQPTAQPSAEPARMAVARSLGGTAGVGQSANLDRALEAANSPAMAPSVAAERSRATQDSPVGPALAPSDQAKILRSRAGAETPSTTIAAEITPDGPAASSSKSTEVVASSSASLTKSNANADKGNVTAAQGIAQLDTGSTRVVDEGGSGRASGGGQVEINVESQSRQVARRRPGELSSDALPTSTVAEQTAAPTSDGGGGASATLNASRTAIERRTAGTGQAELHKENASGQSSGSQVARQSSSQSAQTAGSTGSVASSDSAPTGVNRRPSQQGVAGTGTETSTPSAATGESVSRMGGDLNPGAQVRRAEAVDAPRGLAVAGVGSSAPMRAASAPISGGKLEADRVETAGTPRSSGEVSGLSLDVRGVEASRSVTGPSGATSLTRSGGAIDSSAETSSPNSANASGAGNRATTTQSELNGPQTDPSSASVARSKGVGLAANTLAHIDFSKVESPSETGSELGPGGGEKFGPARLAPSRSTTVAVDAPSGVGGLGDLVAANVGLSKRRASDDSAVVDVNSHRFLKQETGGLPKMSTAAVIPAEAFRRRSARQPGNDPGKGAGRPGPQTEEAIELGLAFLARQQLPDGSWRLNGIPGEEVVFFSDTAATALSLLAFQGAGYNHREHKYANVVFNGLDFLTKNQRTNGDLYLPIDDETSKSAWLYSHSIATIALCESYGMTQDPALREPAQKAITFIVESQDKDLGGWRYAPNYGADTSVGGWMMMALKSGELAGLNVPKQTYKQMTRWLDAAQVSEQNRHQYRYNPYAPDTVRQRHGRQATKTMTAVGLLMRLYSGWRRDNTNLQRGGEYLLQNVPKLTERDTYYWYYATQVMFHIGGESWDRWNSKLHPLLVESQVKNGPLAGSWDPRRPVPDQWGPRVGRLYVTTMNLLSLEVYYRHLPLYVDVAK